jgi:hypothetical protein
MQVCGVAAAGARSVSVGRVAFIDRCPLPNLLDLETLRHPTLPRYGTDYYLVNETTSRSVYQIVNGDAQQVDIAVNQMRWMPFIPQENLNSIITAYQASKDPERRELLSKAYKELAGEDIDTRIMILND